MRNFLQKENSIFCVKELEERLEMTAIANDAPITPIEVDLEVGVDHNGPNAKVTLKWLF